MKVIKILLAISLLLSEVSAQEPINNLKSLQNELITHHPIIKEFEHKIKLQKAVTKLAKSPKDPKVGVELRTNDYPFNLNSIGDFPNNFVGISASKELKVLGKLSLQEEVEKAEVNKLEQELKLTKLILQSELKQKYYELFFLDKTITTYKKLQDLLITIEKSVKSKYEVGKSSQYDLIRIQLENTKLIEKIQSFTKDRESIVTELNALTVRKINASFISQYEDILKEKLALSMNEDSLLEAVKTNYPKILAQGAAIDKALSSIKLAKKEYIPDLNLKAFYAFRNNSDLGSLFGIGLETSLPVFFNSKQRQKHIAAKENWHAEKRKLEDLSINALASARKLFLQIEKSQILTNILEEALLPQANLAVESSLSTYKVGKTDLPSVLDSINDLLKFELENYLELSKGLKSIATLEPILGKEIGENDDK